jgi:hypothetical protein
MSPYKSPLIFLACALGIGLAACGSSSGSSGGSSSSGSASSKLPANSSNMDAAITANWTAFFDAKTPVAKRISLLQNGQQFASVIRAQAGKGLAAEATANVDGILPLTPTTAKVVYDILIAGVPALKAQSGTAVLQNGTWKVGDSSFCGLLITENGGKATGLPAACQTAG